jgi:hypothetical protein
MYDELRSKAPGRPYENSDEGEKHVKVKQVKILGENEETANLNEHRK